VCSRNSTVGEAPAWLFRLWFWAACICIEGRSRSHYDSRNNPLAGESPDKLRLIEDYVSTALRLGIAGMTALLRMFEISQQKEAVPIHPV
jgi:hypothetical protein